jgi:signal peptidase I
MSDPTSKPAQAAPPTPQQKAAALRGLVLGALLAFALTSLAATVLDPETLANPLWTTGRYAAIGLLAWTGWLIGLGRGRVVSENVECLAIAVVMALILKHFLIEAYKIPTGSMQPTILGNAEAGIFDRVLVNKFAYLVDEPERYDVIVFKYPLNQSQNYIKRLMSLGAEEITIQNGNIFAAPLREDGSYGERKIARKPPEARQAVLKTIWPEADGDAFHDRFDVERGNVTADGDELVLDGDTAFRYPADGQSILDRYLDGYDPAWGIEAENITFQHGRERVGDLLMEFDYEPARDGELVLTIAAFGREFRATVGVGEGKVALLECGETRGDDAPLAPLPGLTERTVADAPSPLRAGGSHALEFFHVDQRVQLAIDGEILLAFEYEIGSPLPDTDNSLRIASNAGGTLEDLRLRRDIHYLTTGGQVAQTFRVPRGHLFAMGDNTQNSHDGRQWSAQLLRFHDGTEIVRENGRSDGVNYTDVYGETWSVRTHGPVTPLGFDSDSWHYIPRHLLLGKAIAVFWPIVPQFRWKLIR